MARQETPRTPAEDFLLENDYVTRRSRARQQVLGCLACRLHATEVTGNKPTAKESEIIDCAAVSRHAIATNLNQLEVAGLVVSRPESEQPDHDQPTAPRIYMLADTLGARAFDAILQTPESCKLASNDAL